MGVPENKKWISLWRCCMVSLKAATGVSMVITLKKRNTEQKRSDRRCVDGQFFLDLLATTDFAVHTLAPPNVRLLIVRAATAASRRMRGNVTLTDRSSEAQGHDDLSQTLRHRSPSSHAVLARRRTPYRRGRERHGRQGSLCGTRALDLL